MESLDVTERSKTELADCRSDTGEQRQPGLSDDHVQSLLSVRDVQAGRPSLRVPKTKPKPRNVSELNESETYLCIDPMRWCVFDLRGGPLVLGNLLVPEVLADPETINT